MIDGTPSTPFSAATLALHYPDDHDVLEPITGRRQNNLFVSCVTTLFHSLPLPHIANVFTAQQSSVFPVRNDIKTRIAYAQDQNGQAR
jgi:hypothetical protein